jgi:hypothetical protein
MIAFERSDSNPEKKRTNQAKKQSKEPETWNKPEKILPYNLLLAIHSQTSRRNHKHRTEMEISAEKKKLPCFSDDRTTSYREIQEIGNKIKRSGLRSGITS